MLDMGHHNFAPGNRAQVRALANRAPQKAAMPPWLVKALVATEGSRTGSILRAAMGGEKPDVFPRFARSAIVTSDGHLMAGFYDRNGDYHSGAHSGCFSELRDNVRGLAALLSLSPADGKALCALFQSWLGTDYRSRPVPLSLG